MNQQQMNPQDMSYEQLMELAEEAMKDPQKKAAAMAALNEKAPDGMYEKLSAVFNDLSSEKKQQIRDISKFECDEYMKGDGYKDGQTDTVGYIQCCDVYGFCGGMSPWIIVLIVVLLLCCFAGGTAAFFFFYWQRKMGGKEDEQKEKESENSNTNSEHGISVDTY